MLRSWTMLICFSPCKSVVVIKPSMEGMSLTTKSMRTPWYTIVCSAWRSVVEGLIVAAFTCVKSVITSSADESIVTGRDVFYVIAAIAGPPASIGHLGEEHPE